MGAGMILAALLTGPVLAQTAAPAPKPAASAPAAPGASIPAAQAQDALAVLRDDKRRSELINTLEAIAKTAPPATAAQPAPGTAGSAPAPAATPGQPAATAGQ